MVEEDTKSAWQDAVIAERLEADREFQDRLQQSSLSNQSWELVMTAVEFEIESPNNPDEARLVARTDSLDNVMEAIGSIQARQGGQGGGAHGGSSGGFVDRLLGSLGLGGSGGSHRGEAESMARDYAEQFQQLLEERGKWQSVCERAAE